MPGPLLVVIGPSGGGKSSVVRKLADRGLVRVHPTWTTRPRRSDELDGSLEHRFVDEAAFGALEAAGAFVGTVAMFGLPYRYGLPAVERSADGRLDTVMLRAPLVERFASVVGPPFVVQVEDEPGRIADRLRRRSGSAADLAARLEDNEREVATGRRLADRVFVNDGDLDLLVDAIADALPLALPA